MTDIICSRYTASGEPIRRQYVEQIWTDKNNNVWVSASKNRDYFEISHRHTGGVFPRLFPISDAPNLALATNPKDAARHAARMVRAYEKARTIKYGC